MIPAIPGDHWDDSSDSRDPSDPSDVKSVVFPMITVVPLQSRCAKWQPLQGGAGSECVGADCTSYTTLGKERREVER